MYINFSCKKKKILFHFAIQSFPKLFDTAMQLKKNMQQTNK